MGIRKVSRNIEISDLDIKTEHCSDSGHSSNVIELLSCVSAKTALALEDENIVSYQVIHEVNPQELSWLFGIEEPQIHLLPESIYGLNRGPIVELEIILSLANQDVVFQESIVFTIYRETLQILSSGLLNPPVVSGENINQKINLTHKTLISNEPTLSPTKEFYSIITDVDRISFSNAHREVDMKTSWHSRDGDFFELLRERNALASFLSLERIKSRILHDQLSRIFESRSWKLARKIQTIYSKLKNLSLR